MRAKKRLCVIAEIIENQNVVADIGADHGYLSKMLIEQNRAKKVIATDISKKCLKKTEDLIKHFDFQEKIETRVGDGIDPLLEDEVDLAVIAGLGGQEIIKILSSQNLKGIKRFILQPAQNTPELRKFLIQNNFEIIKDFVVKDQHIFYNTLEVISEGQRKSYSEEQILFGVFCYDNTSEDFQNYISEFISHNQIILDKNINNQKLSRQVMLARKLLK